MHDCPIEGCQVAVGRRFLMCGPHWSMVPSALGRAVYAAWKDGRGCGTAEHEVAMQAAIDAVHGRLAEGR
jgi:hypothetical protein